VELRAHHGAAAQPLTTYQHVAGQKLSVLMTPHLVRSISTPESQLIPSLFFQYCAVEDTASGYALTSCLPLMVSTAEDDALSAAVSSVGYALLSRMTNSSEKLIMARQKYGTAVRTTCNILRHSVASETCWVIRVILVLALFEVGGPDLPFRIFGAKKKLTHKSHSFVQTHRPLQQSQVILKGLLLYSRLGEWTFQIVFLVGRD
jgi:hypothetical protein